jgi:hypothetical protein
MTVYYEEIIELWQAGNYFDAIGFFSQWLSKGLLLEKESYRFNKNLSTLWELIEVECEENPEVMFTLYKMLKKGGKWNDKTLCKKLRISGKATEEIKSRHKPRSEGVGLKMLYELFPQMAV